MLLHATRVTERCWEMLGVAGEYSSGSLCTHHARELLDRPVGTGGTVVGSYSRYQPDTICWYVLSIVAGITAAAASKFGFAVA